MKVSAFFQRVIVFVSVTAIFVAFTAMKQAEQPPLRRQEHSSADLEKYVHCAIQTLQKNLARDIWKNKINLQQIPQKVTESAEIDDARDAIREEQERMLDAMKDENIRTIENLANRYNVNVRDKNGQTPFMVVMRHVPDDTALIDKLLKLGARYTAADRATNIECMIDNLTTLAHAEQSMNNITKEIALFKEQGKDEAKVQDDAARAKIFQRIEGYETSPQEEEQEAHEIDTKINALALIYGKYNELYKKYEEKIEALGGKEKLINSGILEKSKIAAKATAAVIRLSNYTQSDYFKSYTQEEKENCLKNGTYQIIEILFEAKRVENLAEQAARYAILSPAQRAPIQRMLIDLISAAGFNGAEIVKNAETKFITETTQEIENTINRFVSIEVAQSAAQSIGTRIAPLPQEKQSELMKLYENKIVELDIIEKINSIGSLEEAEEKEGAVEQLITLLPEQQDKIRAHYQKKCQELKEAQKRRQSLPTSQKTPSQARPRSLSGL